MSTPLQSMTGILTLTDSRTLAYEEYNVQSTDGVQSENVATAFYFHGFPGSRLEGALLAASATKRRVRLICIDRPGLGLSTPQPGRRLLDWPRDVEQLADHLGIGSFYILAASGGAPYALACAKELQRERLLGFGIIAGVYPLSLGTQDMSLENRVFLWAASSRLASPLLTPLMDWMFGNAARDLEHPERLRDIFAKSMSTKPEQDQRCLRDPEVVDRLVDAMRESFAQGSQGVADDIRVISSPWGFELSEIDGRDVKICLWHGRKDENAPVSMTEKAAAEIRGAQLRILEDEAHLSASFNYHDELLALLLS